MDRTLRPRLERLESRDTPAFAPLQPFGKFGQTSVLAVADLNGDTFADTVVGQTLSTLGTPSVSVLLGTGDGAFNPAQDIVNGLLAGPRSVALADLNGDGPQDLIVASWQGTNTGSVLVFLGQANGSFAAVPSFTDGLPAIAVGVADFTGDGKPDIVSINPDTASLVGGYTIFAGDGAGGFTQVDKQAAPFDVARVAVADFDLDGHTDFIAFDATDRLMIPYFGDATGKFATPAPGFINLNDAPQDVAVGDFDGDGFPDLAIASATGVKFHRNAGARQFDGVGVPVLTAGGTGTRVVAGDVDGDGAPDIVAAEANQIHVYYGGAGGVFTQDPSSPMPIPGATASNDPAIGDVNGDGHLDVVVARQSSIASLASDGRTFINLAPVPTTTALTATPNPGTLGAPVTLTATVNFNGRPFPFGIMPAGQITFEVDFAFFGTAPLINGTATLPANLAVGTHLVVARFLGSPSFQPSVNDGIFVQVNPPDVGTTTYSFEVTGLPTLPGLGADRVASGSFTGDDVRDIALASGPGRPAALSLIDGKSRTVITGVAPFGDGFMGGLMVAAGDIDGDGIDDVAVAADIGGGPRVTIYLVRDGALELTNNFFALDDAFRGGLRIALGDIDGDHHAELVVVGGPGAGPRVATYDGTTLTEFQTPERLFDDFFAMDPDSRLGMFVAVGDANGDGLGDLAVSSDEGGGPRVLLFDGESLIANDPDLLVDFFVGEPDARGGLRIALRDVTPSNEGIELVAGDGPGAGSTVRVYSTFDIIFIDDTEPLITSELLPGYMGGVFVA